MTAPRSVYVAQVDDFDGLYVFEREQDRDAWAEARGTDPDVGECPLIDAQLAARMIADEGGEQDAASASTDVPQRKDTG